MSKQVNPSNLKKSAIDVVVGLVALALGGITAQQANNIKAIWGPVAGSLAMLILALKTDSEKLRWAFIIVGAAHAAKAIKTGTEGKTGFLSMVNTYTPNLSGFSGLKGFSGMRGLNATSTVEQLPMLQPAAQLGMIEEYNSAEKQLFS